MDYYIANAALVAVVIGLVSMIKTMGFPTRFAPLLSLVFGITLSFVFKHETIPLTIFQGIIIGLTSSGFYSGAKTTIMNK